MKKSVSLFVLSLFVFSFAFAEISREYIRDGASNYSDDIEDIINYLPEEDIEEFQEYLSENSKRGQEIARQFENMTFEERLKLREELKSEIERLELGRTIRQRAVNGEIQVLGDSLRARVVDSEFVELIQNEKRVRTRLNLSEDEKGEQLKAMLSNGRNAEIKIMPETANKKAIEQLRLRVCAEENGCTIELKEVGNGENTRAVYEVQAQKTYKFLGLFGRPREVITQIDAESGVEVMTTKRPWWSFLGSEE